MDTKKHNERIKVLNKIQELEKKGIFDVDVEEDPISLPLLPDEIDYLKYDKISKLKADMATKMGKRFFEKMLDEENVIIKEVTGTENFENISTGAIITSNHFNPFEGFTVEYIFRNQEVNKNKNLYKIIREGNYTNFNGFYGYLFKNCYTLPLSSNHQTMKKLFESIKTILKDGNAILIYPEQSMWWNYKKPKPLKDGAYRFAVKNNVPVIPMFITMKETDKLGDDGFPILEYYVHIEKPIYKDNKLSDKENIKLMKDKNFAVWKKIYEDFYKIPLEYSCDKKIN